MSSWTLSETIHLLELFTKNELWENRATEMEKLFGSKHHSEFFTVQACKRELHRVFSQPNPEHVNGLPTHPRSKEAAEMWLKFYSEELQTEQQKSKQMFWVGMRGILDSIQKFKAGKYSADYLRELRDQYRNTDKNKALLNDCLEMFMKRAQVKDLKNVSSTDDLLQLIRGEHVEERVIPSPVKSPRIILPIASPTLAISNSPPLVHKAVQNKKSPKSSESMDASTTSSPTQTRPSRRSTKAQEQKTTEEPIPQLEKLMKSSVKSQKPTTRISALAAKISPSVPEENIVSSTKAAKTILETTEAPQPQPRTRRNLTTSRANRVRYGSQEVVGRVPLLAVWKEICSQRAAGVFYYPVVEEDVPGYHSAVKRPLDLSTIKKMIESGTIETFGEFTSAVVLMFANAVMFNSTDHDVNVAAKELMEQSMHFIMDAQYPCGEFGDVVTASSFPSSSSRRASKSVYGSVEDIS